MLTSVVFIIHYQINTAIHHILIDVLWSQGTVVIMQVIQTHAFYEPVPHLYKIIITILSSKAPVEACHIDLGAVVPCSTMEEL